MPERYQIKGRKLIRRHELGKCWIEFEFTDEWDEETESILKCMDVFWLFDISCITEAIQSGSPNVEYSYAVTFTDFLDDNKLRNQADMNSIINNLLQKLEDIDSEEEKLFNPSYYFHKYFVRDKESLILLEKELILSFFMGEITQEDLEKLIQNISMRIDDEEVGPTTRNCIKKQIEYFQNTPRNLILEKFE